MSIFVAFVFVLATDIAPPAAASPLSTTPPAATTATTTTTTATTATTTPTTATTTATTTTVAAEWIDQKERQVAYASGKATIVANSEPLLKDVASAIKASGAARIVIEVHTDPRGSEVFNQALSQQRAEAVRLWLIERGGVDAGLLVAEGRGETKPAVANTPNRQKNAHTEFRILRGALPAAAEAPVVEGSLGADVIRQVVARGAKNVRACYEKGLLQSPALRGKVTLRFVVGASGSVSSCETKSSDWQAADVEACMCTAVKAWAFPAPKGGGSVIVNFPFHFQPAP